MVAFDENGYIKIIDGKSTEEIMRGAKAFHRLKCKWCDYSVSGAPRNYALLREHVGLEHYEEYKKLVDDEIYKPGAINVFEHYAELEAAEEQAGINLPPDAS